MKEETEEVVPKEEPIKVLLIIFLIIIGLWIISIYLIHLSIPESSNRGTFGDSFGGINSLFSGLAFGGIIYTILLQRKELKLQRLELIATRKELERSAEAQEKSEQALSKQAQSLKSSSQLNALNSLVNTYTEQEKFYSGVNAIKRDEARKQKEKYVAEIEKILKSLN